MIVVGVDDMEAPLPAMPTKKRGGGVKRPDKRPMEKRVSTSSAWG